MQAALSSLRGTPAAAEARVVITTAPACREVFPQAWGMTIPHLAVHDHQELIPTLHWLRGGFRPDSQSLSPLDGFISHTLQTFTQRADQTGAALTSSVESDRAARSVSLNESRRGVFCRTSSKDKHVRCG